MNDPFERPHEEPPAGNLYLPDGAYQQTKLDKLFQSRARLVPLGLVAIAPIYTLAAVFFIDQVVSRLLKDMDESLFTWQLGMTLLAVIPGVAVCVMPLVQRRHLTQPEPFYTYCRRVTIATAAGYPPLAIIAWLMVPADPDGYALLLYTVLGTYVTLMSLFPWAARLNHAAWLRAGGHQALPRV